MKRGLFPTLFFVLFFIIGFLPCILFFDFAPRTVIYPLRSIVYPEHVCPFLLCLVQYNVILFLYGLIAGTIFDSVATSELKRYLFSPTQEQKDHVIKRVIILVIILLLLPAVLPLLEHFRIITSLSAPFWL